MNGQPQNPTENVDKEYELELAERQSWIEMYEALQRLEENKDFKKIILDGYLKDSAVDKVSLLATDYVRTRNLRATIFEELVAISALEGYLHTIKNMGAPVEDDELEG
jgi:hypothetical protein